MKIRIERSGGMAGITASNEIEIENLPPTMRYKIQEILDNKEPNSTRMSMPKGAADYLNYRITFPGGNNKKVIECNQFNINDDLRNLIRYIETHSKKN